MLDLIVRVLVAAVLVLMAAGIVVIGGNFLLDLAVRLFDPFPKPPKQSLGRGGFVRSEVLIVGGAFALVVLVLLAVGGAYKLGVVIGRGDLYETALRAQGQVIDLAPKVAAAQAACAAPATTGPTVHRGAR